MEGCIYMHDKYHFQYPVYITGGAISPMKPNMCLHSITPSLCPLCILKPLLLESVIIIQPDCGLVSECMAWPG